MTETTRTSSARPCLPPGEAAARWRALDDTVRGWWDGDLRTATPADVTADGTGTLLPLPHPYSSAGGSEGAFPEMYGWDTHFVNLALLLHGRHDVVRDHLRNAFAMVEEHGMVLNGNRTYYLTRSQPPVLADSLARYLADVPDRELAARGTAALEREYTDYWCGDHHRAGATGLATNRDLGDPTLRAELASEAETGLDFTAQFGGDVRRCAPLITNACLVRTAEVLADLHEALGAPHRALEWRVESARRATALRDACWDDDDGTFLEVDVETGQRLPVRSLSAYLPLWAGAATERQATALVRTLPRFRAAHGLTTTDRPHPSPHPGLTALQWQHPVGWPPLHVLVVQGLLRAGFPEHARRVARDFVDLQVEVHRRTGSLWEKYDVVEGGVDVPVERYPSVPMHGWSSASVVVLGRVAHEGAARPSPSSLVPPPLVPPPPVPGGAP